MSNYGYDDNGERVPITSAASPNTFATICELLASVGVPESQMETIRPELLTILEGHDDNYNAESMDGVRKFIGKLTADGSAKCVGQRLYAIAYLMGLTKCESQRQLAKKLNVSFGRITQILRSMPSDLKSLCRLSKLQPISRDNSK